MKSRRYSMLVIPDVFERRMVRGYLMAILASVGAE